MHVCCLQICWRLYGSRDGRRLRRSRITQQVFSGAVGTAEKPVERRIRFLGLCLNIQPVWDVFSKVIEGILPFGTFRSKLIETEIAFFIPDLLKKSRPCVTERALKCQVT